MADITVPESFSASMIAWSPVINDNANAFLIPWSPIIGRLGGSDPSNNFIYILNGRLKFGATVPVGGKMVGLNPV